eukprot:gene30105-35073_t
MRIFHKCSPVSRAATISGFQRQANLSEKRTRAVSQQRSNLDLASSLNAIRITKGDGVNPVTLATWNTLLGAYAGQAPSSAAVVMDVIEPYGRAHEAKPGIPHDHFAFRTFGVGNCGISSLAILLNQLGYEQRQEQFEFPVKKLLATWFAASNSQKRVDVSHLPRIFVSQLEVHKLSPKAQEIVNRYVSSAVAVHRLNPSHSHSDDGTLLGFSEEVRLAGFPLNMAGGVVKASPDGGLLQSSTAADKVVYRFSCGTEANIAGAYLEFVYRLSLPEFQNLPSHELQEWHRRDGFERVGISRSGLSPPQSEPQNENGFEVGNAEKIFLSTDVISK